MDFVHQNDSEIGGAAGHSMTIEAEMLQLGDLRHVGMALLEFARSLSAGEFVKTGAAWIYRPNNFVGFEIRYKRTKKLNVLTRPVGVPDDIKQILRNWRGPLGYLRLEVDSPRKLGAACVYIEASSKKRVSRRLSIANAVASNLKEK